MSVARIGVMLEAYLTDEDYKVDVASWFPWLPKDEESGEVAKAAPAKTIQTVPKDEQADIEAAWGDAYETLAAGG